MGYDYTGPGLSQYGLQAAYAVYGPQVYSRLKRKSEYGIIDVSGPATARDAGLREHYGGTITVTEEEEKKKRTMSTGEHTRRRYRRGKKKQMLAKKVNSVVEPLIARFQGLNNYMTTDAGYFKLFNHKDTSATATLTAPIHMYDITAWVNNVSGALSYAPLGRCLQYTAAAGAGWTAPIQGVFQNGAGNTNVWTVEHTGHNVGVNIASHKRDILEWFDYRMLCYGRTVVPTRWRVAIVQLMDDGWHPHEVTTDGPPVSDGNPYNEFWNSLSAPFMNNPIEGGNPYSVKGHIKYLHCEDFMIESLSTTDGVGANIPKVHEVRGFHRFNRLQNYGWDTPLAEAVYANATFGGPGATYDGQNKWQSTTSDYSNMVQPKARIYLMVAAQSGATTSAAPGVWSAAVNPSYDLFMRVKHLIED